ncbi:DUF882 domain-containing protein [Vibrio sp. ZSDE26]|uniref:Murein endopeptidase K n=1 Tax=Vibrio amylolyticus TaxID=2847292 RepID=A0A9X1XF60_9VIBR|nr:YcbK family protein [Vibrio amylolyticus]MCK6261809.1 DUF882 domain-containing protein [Vibrio amylolyticus]
MVFSRRHFLKLAGGSLVIASGIPSIAQASYPDRPRHLVMNNLHTGESVEASYFNGVDYVEGELDRLNYLCRDFRRNEVHPMDRRLFDKISKIQTLLGTEAEVQIISGFRSPATNEALRANSNGVAKKSFHMLGQAMDFRLEGVNLKQVRDAALSLKSGGVGYYPRSNFIHIDTGPVRSWA